MLYIYYYYYYHHHHHHHYYYYIYHSLKSVILLQIWHWFYYYYYCCCCYCYWYCNCSIHEKITDWLRALQRKCNTSAKRVTPVQIIHRNSGLWFAETGNGKFSKPMQNDDKRFVQNFYKSFLECEKMASGKTFRHVLPANFFIFILSVSDDTVFFSLNLKLICTYEFFKFQLFENLTRAN